MPTAPKILLSRCCRYWLAIAMCCIGINGHGQTRAPGDVKYTPEAVTSGKTYALVVGISHYKNVPSIPMLSYAHQDALDFATLLEHSGTCLKENIALLRDDSATAANVFKSVQRFVRDAKEGDRVIIYFAGHGDIDNILSSGFLLTYGCVNGVYDGGDAISLQRLQEYINKLGENKVNVLMITDACRSGTFAGGKETMNTIKAMGKVVKILSCAPSELSEERYYKTYGVGHGVFTRYLLEGLTGFADLNHDNIVTLMELQRYLQDSVSAATEGRQTPVLDGNNPKVPLIGVNESMKNAMTLLLEGKVGRDIAFAEPTIHRAVNEPKTYSPAEEALAAKFYDRIREHNLAGPKADNAFELLDKVDAATVGGNFLQDLKWELAAMLEDDAQTWLNKYLKADHFYSSMRKANICQQVIDELGMTLKLLGKENPRYNEIKAKQLFFKAYNINLQEHGWEFAKGLKFLEKADSVMPDMAYILNVMGIMQAWGSPSNPKAAMEHFKKASKLAPKWIYPPVNIAWLYIDLNDFKEADKYLQIAEAIDSLGDDVWLVYGDLYSKQKMYDKAEQSYRKAITISAQNIDAYYGLGNLFADIKDFNKAELNYKKALEIDSNKIYVYAKLGNLYRDNKLMDKALECYNHGLKVDSLYPDIYDGLAGYHTLKKEYERAKEYYLKAISIDAYNSGILHHMADLCTVMGDAQQAAVWLARAKKAEAGDTDGVKGE